MVIVKVGATKNAKGRYSEMSGYNYYIFDTGTEALEFERKVKQAWIEVDESLFVYGEPETEIIYPLFRNPEDAAANWHLSPED